MISNGSLLNYCTLNCLIVMVFQKMPWFFEFNSNGNKGSLRPSGFCNLGTWGWEISCQFLKYFFGFLIDLSDLKGKLSIYLVLHFHELRNLGSEVKKSLKMLASEGQRKRCLTGAVCCFTHFLYQNFKFLKADVRKWWHLCVCYSLSWRCYRKIHCDYAGKKFCVAPHKIFNMEKNAMEFLWNFETNQDLEQKLWEVYECDGSPN